MLDIQILPLTFVVIKTHFVVTVSNLLLSILIETEVKFEINVIIISVVVVGVLIILILIVVSIIICLKW